MCYGMMVWWYNDGMVICLLQLLMGYESGLLVLWDLKGKFAEIRWQAAEPVKSIAWHYEGKYFVSSHTDGTICSWPTRPTPKPQSLVCPHGKFTNLLSSSFCFSFLFFSFFFFIWLWLRDIVFKSHLQPMYARTHLSIYVHIHLACMRIQMNKFLLSAKTNKDGALEKCKAIYKVDLKATVTGYVCHRIIPSI